MSADRVAALREEIGSTIRQNRRRLRLVAAGYLAAGVTIALLAITGHLIIHGKMPVTGLVVLVALVNMLRTISNHHRLQSLRDQLTRLDSAARERVLAPFRGDRSQEAREIIGSLTKMLRLPAELAPAPSPDAHGDEASPAERAP